MSHQREESGEKKINLNAANYNAEISRRSSKDEKKTQPKGWKNPDRIKWLVEHPVLDEEKSWIFENFEKIMNSLDKRAAEDVVPGSNI